MANKAQLIVSSSQTYFNNTAGNITPDSVNAFNTTWINSSVLNDNTASLMITASAQASTITFTNGDGSTYLVQIAQSGSSVSSSYAVFAETSRSSSLASSASFALRGNGNFTGSFSGSVSASFSGSGVGIFGIVSSSYAVTASLAINASTASFLLGTVASASYAINADLLDGIDSTGYAKTGSNTFKGPNTFEDGVVLNNITAQAAGADGGNINITPFTASKVVLHNNQVTSGSITIKDQTTGNEVILSSDNTPSTLAVNGNIQANSPFSFVGNATQLTAVTASLVNTLNQTVTISGSLSVSDNTTLANVTASNVKITGTASIAFLDVTFQSSSIIYSSGSNQFGDASDDTQTLYGTINVITGPLVVTGSANFKETITGSISGNAATANSSTSASYAYTASSAVNAASSISASYALSASFAEKSITTVIVTNNGSGYYLLDGVIKPLVTFVRGTTYKFDTSGVVGSHPFRFSLTENGPTTYDVGVTVGTNYTEIDVDYATSSSLFYYCTNHSGMGNEANILKSNPFPFTGSAVITGSLNLVGALYIPSGSIEITGSATIISGSLKLFSYKVATNVLNKTVDSLFVEPLNSTNNIISVSTTGIASTGSFIVSGSGNYVSLSSLVLNSNIERGATTGFNGTNAYVTVMPLTTGSNPNFNTTADRNNRRVPTITNSNVNAAITFVDNRASESVSALAIANSSINSTISSTIDSGSLSISNSNIAGTALIVSSSNVFGGTGGNGSITNSIISTNNLNIRLEASGARAASLNTSIIAGSTIRLLLSASAASSANLSSNLIVGDTLIVTSSHSAAGAGLPVGSAFLGSFNAADGVLNSPAFTRFAIGTGTGTSARRTSLHVSSSGLTTISDGLRVSGSQVITGSLYGSPVSQSVSSNTASLNLLTGNFFNLTLPASANTYITASGQLDGQTINLKITQQATTGSVSLGAGIKQVSGSAYTVTAVASAVDIVTFISFDNTGLYVSNVKNLV